MARLNLGKVKCELCQKEFKILTNTHMTKSHDMTLKEYKEKFPGARLAGGEFGAAQKHKSSLLFAPRDESKEPDPEPTIDLDPVLDEGVVVLDDAALDGEFSFSDKEFPEVEELDVPGEVVNYVQNETIQKQSGHKYKIFAYLKRIYPTLVSDYLIEKFVQGRRQIYQYITDMAVPDQKIDFEFPNTFWHNVGGPVDVTRDKRLQEDGWTVIRFKARHPSVEDVRVRVESELLRL